MSDIAKKFYELMNGGKPEKESSELQKQVQIDGVDHNRQEQKKQADYREAGQTSSEPREKGVSGFFGRVALTEETPDGKIITHVKGLPAPGSETQPAKPTDQTSDEAETRKIRIGTTDYNADQLLAYDWETGAKKVFDAGKLATADSRFRELEKPASVFNPVFPHQGREDNFIDYQACKYANAAFIDLNKHIGDHPGQVDPQLIAAVIRNEQFFYKNFYDTGPDHFIDAKGNWPYNRHYSIGPAQIQVETINHLAEKFPDVLGPPKTSVISAEDIHRAPFFVGAYFADVIHGIEQNQKPNFISDSVWQQVTEKWHDGKLNEALIISYNPDPKQIANVGAQLKVVKKNHPN